MLKITATTDNGRRTLTLEGKLMDPWLTELERAWEETRQAAGSRTVLIDLKDVTVISERGQGLLTRMMTDGATFNCCRGVLTRHVVQQLLQEGTVENRRKGVKE